MQLRRAVDDHFQPLPAAGDRAYLVIGPDCGGQHGQQAGLRQFGLGAVVVDLEIGNDRQFRRVAGLAGAQDDAQFGKTGGAQVADKVQPGGGRFHDHVDQRRGDIVMAADRFPGFLRRMRMDQFDRPVEDRLALQGKAGGDMNIVVVIDDQDAPYPFRRFTCGAWLVIVDDDQKIIRVIVIVQHCRLFRIPRWY